MNSTTASRQDTHQDTRRAVRRPARTRIIAAAAVALATGAALSGCSLLENDAWAVTYEVSAVSGAAADTSTAVEYTDRASRGAEQLKASNQAAIGGGVVEYESLALLDESVSVSAAAVPGVVLRCEIKLDGERVIAEAESAAGEGVECATTTPASLDD